MSIRKLLAGPHAVPFIIGVVMGVILFSEYHTEWWVWLLAPFAGWGWYLIILGYGDDRCISGYGAGWHAAIAEEEGEEA